jgi:long-subunit fatty acid transport protein
MYRIAFLGNIMYRIAFLLVPLSLFSLDTSSPKGIYGGVSGGASQIFNYNRDTEEEDFFEFSGTLFLGYEVEKVRHQLFYMFQTDGEYEEPIHSFGYEKLWVWNFEKFSPFLKAGGEYGFQEFSEEDKEKFELEKSKIEFLGASLGIGSYYEIKENFEISLSYQYNFRFHEKVEYKSITNSETDDKSEFGTFQIGAIYKF